MMSSLYLPNSQGLKGLVRFYGIMNINSKDTANHWLNLFPNCTTNICIHLDNGIPNEALLNRNTISTSCIRTANFYISKAFNAINIQFEPYGLYLLTGIPMKQFVNSSCTIDTFFKASAIERLYSQLSEISNEADIVSIIDGFLMDQLTRKRSAKRVAAATSLIAHGRHNMDKLTHHLNISNRGIRKLFSQSLGISPHHFSKLKRFNKATQIIASDAKTSLTSIALDLGYYDQAHFIKDFKEFGGITPGAFRKMKSKSAIFYNYTE